MIPAVAGTAASTKKTYLPYLWLVGGAAGQLYTSTSTTASSWTSRTTGFGTSDVLGIASDSTSLYVIVGTSGKLATSPDGTTWTSRTSSFGTTTIKSVAWGAGYWVAVGDLGMIATSTDGTTWTQRTGALGTSLRWVSFSGSNWVIGADSGGIQTTGTDPTTGWTSRTSTLTGNNVKADYSTLGSIWIAGNDTGTTGALASSTDATTWTARDSASNLSTALGANTTNNNSVIVLTCVAVCQTSTNGTTWTARTRPAGYTSYTTVGIAVDDNQLFAVLSNNGGAPELGFIETSTDGVTWTGRGSTGMTSPQAICFSSGKPPIR